ncbi:MAG: hypothetical protein JNM07_11675 [Phycisphaerae bacterium]|nr:hypothetical protein [Phycisphaerae bacterium]
MSTLFDHPVSAPHSTIEPLRTSDTHDRPNASHAAQGPVLRRTQLMDRIITINPTASRDFLDRFADRALATYLEHLETLEVPRGSTARWVRPGDTPAAVSRHTDD